VRFGRLERRRLALLLDPARPEPQPFPSLFSTKFIICVWRSLRSSSSGLGEHFLYFFLGEMGLGVFFGV